MEYKLSDLFALQMGKTPARDEPRYWQNGRHSWISIADLSSVDKFIEETKESISDCAVKESNISMIPEGTVVMSFKLSLGKVAITKKAMYSNEAIMAFIPRAGVDISTDYLYYLLKARRWDTGGNKAVKGITLNKATLSSVKVCIHSAEEQRLIVNILDKLKSVIKRRQSQLAKLDELVKCRFVEMFGDISASTPQWCISQIRDLVTVEPQNGLYKAQSFYVKQGATPILRIDAFYNGKVTDFTHLKRLKCTQEEIKKFLLKENDIVINRVNSIEYLGKCALIQGLLEDTVFESNMMRFHFDENLIDPVYATFLLSSRYTYVQILSKAKKAVNQASINQKDVLSINIPVPPLHMQQQFSSFVQHIDKLRFFVGRV